MRGVDQTLGYIFPLFLVGVRLLTTLFPLPRSRLSLKPVIHLILIPSSFRFPFRFPFRIYNYGLGLFYPCFGSSSWSNGYL